MLITWLIAVALFAQTTNGLSPGESEFLDRSQATTKRRIEQLVSDLRDARKSTGLTGKERRQRMERIRGELRRLRSGELVPAALILPMEAGRIGALPASKASVVEVLGAKSARVDMEFVLNRRAVAQSNRVVARTGVLQFVVNGVDLNGAKAGDTIALPRVVRVDDGTRGPASSGTWSVTAVDLAKLLRR